MTERSFITRRRVATLLLVIACTACSSTARRNDWEHRLQGDAVVMLGEVHDNAEHHRLRLEVLRRAFAAGWRPAIAMEQLDRERQADIDRARREKPSDARHLIALAAPSSGRAGGAWNWDFYRPFVALALEYDVPLIAANLSSSDTTKIVRGGYSAVFDDASIAMLGLDQPIAADWQAAQEREIDAGHCQALPQPMWPRMARAQFARDAVMAAALREHAGSGVVLLAGNGHVRRDIGVPRWMSGAWQGRIFTVAHLERGDESTLASAFDAVVQTPPAPRPDPCAILKRAPRTGATFTLEGPVPR
jgi:uncharacterized iron-regulated protein